VNTNVVITALNAADAQSHSAQTTTFLSRSSDERAVPAARGRENWSVAAGEGAGPRPGSGDVIVAT
jgi:hypothetical protein